MGIQLARLLACRPRGYRFHSRNSYDVWNNRRRIALSSNNKVYFEAATLSLTYAPLSMSGFLRK